MPQPLPSPIVNDFDDCQRNFDALVTSGLDNARLLALESASPQDLRALGVGGLSDNTAALNNALEWCLANGKRAWLPLLDGGYPIKSPVIYPAGMEGLFSSGGRIVAASDFSGGPMLRNDDQAEGGDGVRLEGVEIDGNRASQDTQVALVQLGIVDGARDTTKFLQNVKLVDFWIHDAPLFGLQLPQVRDFWLDHALVSDCDRDGIHCNYDCRNGHFLNPRVWGCGDDHLAFWGDVAWTTNVDAAVNGTAVVTVNDDDAELAAKGYTWPDDFVVGDGVRIGDVLADTGPWFGKPFWSQIASVNSGARTITLDDAVPDTDSSVALGTGTAVHENRGHTVVNPQFGPNDPAAFATGGLAIGGASEIVVLGGYTEGFHGGGGTGGAVRITSSGPSNAESNQLIGFKIRDVTGYGVLISSAVSYSSQGGLGDVVDTLLEVDVADCKEPAIQAQSQFRGSVVRGLDVLGSKWRNSGLSGAEDMGALFTKVQDLKLKDNAGRDDRPVKYQTYGATITTPKVTATATNASDELTAVTALVGMKVGQRIRVFKTGAVDRVTTIEAFSGPDSITMADAATVVGSGSGAVVQYLGSYLVDGNTFPLDTAAEQRGSSTGRISWTDTNAESVNKLLVGHNPGHAVNKGLVTTSGAWTLNVTTVLYEKDIAVTFSPAFPADSSLFVFANARQGGIEAKAVSVTNVGCTIRLESQYGDPGTGAKHADWFVQQGT